jgi:hypothetical protein
MFKKVIQSLSKSLIKQADPTPAPSPPKPEPAPAPAAAKKAAKPTPILQAIADGPALAAPEKPVAPAPAKVEAPKSPEELCGVEGKMNKDQIRERLKLLYRRYNRAASSLNSATRAEAEKMLDAIVALREKTFGEI